MSFIFVQHKLLLAKLQLCLASKTSQPTIFPRQAFSPLASGEWASDYLNPRWYSFTAEWTGTVDEELRSETQHSCPQRESNPVP